MTTTLVEAIDAYTAAHPGENPWMTEVDGLILLRMDREHPPRHIISRPALCVVVQGAKWTSFGEDRHHYRAGQALVVNVEMPSVGRITEAAPGKPFLGVVIEFDPAIMREVYDRLEQPPAIAGGGAGRAAFVVDMDSVLLDCVFRLVRLLDKPEAIPILAPMIRRELAYWLLAGPTGGEIAEMALGRDRSNRIVRAIHLLRDNFTAPLRIADLAAEARLSPSAFHRQFKAVTAMTPLQYQKRLRLLEARRMILADSAKVETAAYATGYESPSQFSREYARMFGQPPKRDAAVTREVPEWA